MKRNTQTLDIYLNDILVGQINHQRDGKNIFSFDQTYIERGQNRPLLSLSFLVPFDEEATVIKKLSMPYVSMIKLPVFFSNLLPEGALRQFISSQLKIHQDHEFELLAALGQDLPGAIIAKPVEEWVMPGKTQANQLPSLKNSEEDSIHFSLAGIQIKFSMIQQNQRLTLPKYGEYGDYIVKTPFYQYANVPENEYSMMQLAESIGIEVPETELVPLEQLEGLPKMNFQHEKWAYVVKRFDRDKHRRIHIEDFAQVINVREDRKYTATNYDTIGRLIYDLFKDSASQIEELVRRLTFNLLIGNTDAHLKNFSVIYRDGKMPELSPAYDLISTLSYINNRDAGLNMAKQKYFYDINMETFRYFAKRINAPEALVLNAVNRVVEKAKSIWPEKIKQLPLTENQLSALKGHSAKLQFPFNIF